MIDDLNENTHDESEPILGQNEITRGGRIREWGRRTKKDSMKNRGDLRGTGGYLNAERIVKALKEEKYSIEEEVKLLVDVIRTAKTHDMRIRAIGHLSRMRYDAFGVKPPRPGPDAGKEPLVRPGPKIGDIEIENISDVFSKETADGK